MYDLYLNDEGGAGEGCHLSPVNPLIRAMHYHPGAGDGLTVTDRMELVVESSPLGIGLVIETAERWLEQAGREYGLPGGAEVLLWAQVDQRNPEVWRSRLLGGRVRLGAAGLDQRSQGAQGLTVEIVREDVWASNLRCRARLSNSSGDNSAGPLVLNNHRDTEHWNSLAYTGPTGGPEDITGSLPAGGVLTWQPVSQPHPQALTVLIGHGCRPNISRLVDTYPAEGWRSLPGSGVSWSSPLDPTCAGGQYLQLDWSGSAEVALMYFNLAWADADILAGGPVRLVLRLKEPLSPLPEEQLWYRWRISVVEDGAPYPAGESSSQFMETGQQLVIGPLMNLPPWQISPGWPGGRSLRLELLAQAAGSGPHTLRLDTITVLPCDGWRIYRPITAKPTYGLVDDQPHGVVLGTDAMQTHTVEGPGFTLRPMQEQRWWVFVLQHEANGQQSAPLELQSTLAVEFYPRRRTV